MSREASRKVAFHDFELDLENGDLTQQGEPVRLAAQPARALVLLARRAGELVLRGEIQQHVWGDLVIEQEQGLNTCIRQIRSALGDRPGSPRFIETIPRRGYRLIAPVTAVPEAAPNEALARGEAPTPVMAQALPAQQGPAALVTPTSRPWSRVLGRALVAALVLGLVAFLGNRLRQRPVLSGAPPVSTDASVPAIEPQAWEAYLRGLYLLKSSTPPDPPKARAELHRALELDPRLARAHVALADAYHVEWRSSTLDLQRSALAKALDLDPDLAAAHLRLAKIQLYADWDFAGSGRSFERALALAPGDAEVRQGYALYLSHLRRHDEAIEQVEYARQLDPISAAVHGDGGMIYFSARRYEQAVEVCERTLELAPGHYEARTCLLHAYRRLGRHRQALQQAIELMRLLGASEEELRSVTESAETGSALRHFFEWQVEWLRRQKASPVAMAAAVLPLGRVDEVFAWLEQAYEQRSGNLLAIAADPRADAFREDPRFIDLLQRVGFPAETIER